MPFSEMKLQHIRCCPPIKQRRKKRLVIDADRYWTPHFHTVTHEAYAITSGSSTICMGVGPLDDPRHGTVLRVKKGDMIVNPTGVMHASITASGSRTSSSDGDAGSAPDNDVVEEGEPYEYVGLYPRGSPKYDNNFGKVGPEETEKKGRVARNVPIPESDPVNGEGGPLTRIWKATEM